MAKENSYWPNALWGSDGQIVITGYFTTNNTSNPAAFAAGPYTITRTGVGRFKVAFNEPVKEVRYQAFEVDSATNGTDKAKALAPSAGTSTENAFVECQYQSAEGTAAESTGKVIRFIAVLRKSARKDR